jgi:large subunit ribosomal protein L21
MQAVIRTGGKQYYVTAGDILEVEKLAGGIGDVITLSDVLMVANDEDVTVGQPTVDNAAVTAKITGQYRGNKILVFRYRPKKRIRVRRGHRQYLTRLEIQSIRIGDEEYTTPVREEPQFVTPEPVIEDSTIADTTGTVSAPVVVDVGDEPVTIESAEPIVSGTTEELNAAAAQSAADAADELADNATSDNADADKR